MHSTDQDLVQPHIAASLLASNMDPALTQGMCGTHDHDLCVTQREHSNERLNGQPPTSSQWCSANDQGRLTIVHGWWQTTLTKLPTQARACDAGSPMPELGIINTCSLTQLSPHYAQVFAAPYLCHKPAACGCTTYEVPRRHHQWLSFCPTAVAFSAALWEAMAVAPPRQQLFC